MPKYLTNRSQLYVKSLRHEPWNANIYLVWCDSKKRIDDFLDVNNDGDTERLYEKTEACVYNLRRGGKVIPTIVIPFKFDFSPGHVALLSHECLHAVIALFRYIRVPLPKDIHHDESDEENLCYTHQWLFQECLDAILNQDKHKFKFNDER